jgi:hypothetical protein
MVWNRYIFDFNKTLKKRLKRYVNALKITKIARKRLSNDENGKNTIWKKLK